VTYLVVTKLDRLARNTKEGIEIVETLFNKGVRVHVLNVGLWENTTMGRFFLQTMLAVAEMERNLITERTQERKAIAKQKGDFRDGRPKKFNKKQIHGIYLFYSFDLVNSTTLSHGKSVSLYFHQLLCRSNLVHYIKLYLPPLQTSRQAYIEQN
jgi:hypothetical protein